MHKAYAKSSVAFRYLYTLGRFIPVRNLQHIYRDNVVRAIPRTLLFPVFFFPDDMEGFREMT